MNNQVEVTITQSNAIYINDHRITDRRTKPWGGSPNIANFYAPKDAVVETIVKNGFKHLLKFIDEEPYVTKTKELL
jgi:hypothetical protein